MAECRGRLAAPLARGSTEGWAPGEPKRPRCTPLLGARRKRSTGRGGAVGSNRRRDVDTAEAEPAQRTSLPAAAKRSGMNQQEPDGLRSGERGLVWSGAVPLPPGRSRLGGDQAAMSASAVQCSPTETFSSSFSFIQQSLSSSQTAGTPLSPHPEPKTAANAARSECPVQLPPAAASGDPADSEDLPSCGRFWQRGPWDRRGEPPDCDAVDIEIVSSLSVDSDNASASSVTSGYESATAASDQGWDNLLKKQEGVLQDCLQKNRTYTKVGTPPQTVKNRNRHEVWSQQQ